MPITQLLAQASNNESLYWLLVSEFRGIPNPNRTGQLLEKLVDDSKFLSYGRQKFMDKWACIL